ncbi:alpha-L-arabinofuranosidase C-terminal domain-containing protein [Desertivirga brevis]|uniref:alpha-L-arabinofuranosidase C-terminal domain-containing protein n=1 Tax=Desertivirga brevis TaxID=2810310 RepID=UPI001A973888|nr:alpha-L-arabinofuranosidase C-terminal domain-containing protein [Pedobacter sp. SYSU D00873]
MNKSIVTRLIAPALLLININAFSQKQPLVINIKAKGAEIAPSMYGVFFEEINHAGDGGLYAELVKNRSFEELEMPEGYTANDRLIPPRKVNHLTGQVVDQTFGWTKEPVPGWNLKTIGTLSASVSLTKENPRFDTAPNSAKIRISDASSPVLFINDGYWGMGIAAGEKYHLRTILRTSADYRGTITAKLISQTGQVLASAILKKTPANEWTDLKTVLQPFIKDSKAKLALEFNSKGTVWLDYVSLFPEKTFNNRKNGLRKDVADMVSGLKPAFVRWPGGCVVEGITVENRFEWKKTLGDPASRPGEYSLWGYRSSYGFGYYELLQFCEDMGADAMFVASVGIGCQYRAGDACSKDSVEYYLNDCMDAIEYALGDRSTEWGAKRAAAGHPKPFPLKYIEIGNENWGDEYDERFDIFYSAIKKKYPQLILISNHGVNGTGKIAKTDRIDPHWYVSPDWFLANTTIFDNHPRDKYTVYVGEYAANQAVGGGNMSAALSEAAFIGGMERNGDLVKMASYAPLLENRNDRSWPVNLIWLDSEKVLGRSSYYVQKMAAENRPNYNVQSNFTMSAPQQKDIAPGSFGFGSWETQVEFKDLKINRNGQDIGVTLSDNTVYKGTWNVSNAVLAQTSTESGTKALVKGFKGNNYTLEFKARKTGGKEGFFIYFGMDDEGKEGLVFNVAGWNNSATAVERITNGNQVGAVSKSIPHKIDVDKWYNVKLVCNGQKAQLFMDGDLILAYENQSPPMQFFSSGYDSTKDEVILKVVNAAGTAWSQNVKIEGAGSISTKGRVISLTANKGEDENSFVAPERIYPKESEYTKFAKEFEYTFPPFSYTILRIKAAK